MTLINHYVTISFQTIHPETVLVTINDWKEDITMSNGQKKNNSNLRFEK